MPTPMPYMKYKLSVQRPDLFAKVEAGELSTFAAACEAGYTKRQFSVRGDPSQIARILTRRLKQDQVLQLIESLRKELDANN